MENFNFKEQNIVIKFLIINTLVFIAANLIVLFGFFFGAADLVRETLIRMIAVPASLHKLYKIWTPFTYMFFHLEFFHFLFNMLWLYFLGLIFVNYIDEDKFVSVYILGGLAGAFLFILSYNIFPVFWAYKEISVALGASAAITAIIVAIAYYQPFLDVYLFGIFRIKLMWIAIFYVIYDIISIPSSNAGGHIAHLGGAIFGFVFAYYLKKGIDITYWFTKLWKKIDFTKPKKPKFKVHYNFQTRDDYEYNANRKKVREEIDRILTKISKKGYKSLSKKEREFLDKYKDYI